MDRSVDIGLLKGISSHAHVSRCILGVELQVSLVGLVGLSEPPRLAELLGDAEPGLREVGVALDAAR